jgi:plasmid stability protein
MIIYTVTVFEEGEQFTDRLVKQIRAAGVPAETVPEELLAAIDAAADITVVREAACRNYVPDFTET